MNLFLLIAGGMCRDIPNPEGYTEIAEHLGLSEVTPLEIIERLQKNGFSEQTHIGNEHLKLLFSRICTKLESLKIDCSYSVETMNTHLYVDGREIKQFDDIQDLVNRTKHH